MNSIILIGCGGHCKSCIDVIERANYFKIKGIIEKPNTSKKEFMGYKVIGDDNQLKECFEEGDFGFITVGQIKDPQLRINLFNNLKKMT